MEEQVFRSVFVNPSLDISGAIIRARACRNSEQLEVALQRGYAALAKMEAYKRSHEPDGDGGKWSYNTQWQITRLENAVEGGAKRPPP